MKTGVYLSIFDTLDIDAMSVFTQAIWNVSAPGALKSALCDSCTIQSKTLCTC